MPEIDRIDFLKTEVTLLQATLDKYDDLIFRGRNSFMTLWIACMGLSFTIRSDFIPLLAVGLSAVYWILEGLMRHQYWFKYVDRYRSIREYLNGGDNLNGKVLSIYDLTNRYHRSPAPPMHKIGVCFFKLEPTALYWFMGASALLVWILLRMGILAFPA